ncbi:hypothetical protein EVAR_54193_1 [Eumeta japonica]|uniref:Uncharacterized protein n=1 Tax=Eumeta variegata TaxID=151549 RepID=A0A4C1YHS0_EUMVA|nr:hypothetical protein EVAR_54193_1 [Eumeta japonica]
MALRGRRAKANNTTYANIVHTKPDSTFGNMATLVAVIIASIGLIFMVGTVPSTEYSCAPFFFQKVKHEGKVYKSIVRFQCDRSPPFDGTCDPTFTERVYYRTVSGYSCMVEYLARPTPLLEEPPCSDREGYDDYFKQLGMAATPAGWVLQDAKAGVLLQVRPNIPHRRNWSQQGPKGKRAKGRPIDRWTDDLRKVAGDNWIEAAGDRAQWRQLEEAYTREGP